MTIMGLDPGVARVGWAIIHVHGNDIHSLAYGCIETQKGKLLEMRLKEIYGSVTRLMKKYKPETVVIEELFFSTNAKTAMSVGQARGVVLLAAADCRTQVASYSPSTIKQTITGSGNADKKQVERMVTLTLHLKEPPKPDDTADALAIAMTHAYSYKVKRFI